MKVHGLEISVKNLPVLDTGFIPMAAFCRDFEESAKNGKEIAVAVERNQGQVAVRRFRIHGTPAMREADAVYVDRTVKMLLWAYGGFKVVICGDEEIGAVIAAAYRAGGSREFDANFMSRVYERPFEVESRPLSQVPAAYSLAQSVGRNVDGCRIGFDAGGSDRKVSAVIDGVSVYSEEVVWFPKTNADPDYHYQGILDAFRTAASKMPRVDAIGVSSAGVYIDNRAMVASLFIKVPEDLFDEKVKNIYLRAAKELGENIPIEVANDGDVTALAGAMSLERNKILGIAMGTSEAAGYVDGDGNITGWLNELAFAPVDLQEDAMVDEWSGDKGCGVKYFSQDSVIKLAPRAGITLDESLSPAEKLKVVQHEIDKGNDRALDIYRSIGTYLGHTLAYYAMYYEIGDVLLLGRVMSGKGGELIIEEARRVLAEEYPAVSSMELHLPDEKIRRVGQSVAAASLPKIG
ncbi:MAG: ROK family protein [Clostridia bacterium]|nr:ROK family protein [Clostridia bacterium]